jgi:transcriptional regulator GlxA family with amidase domain
MQVAVVIFDGFSEIDSFAVAHILNRLSPKGWKAFITSPSEVATSMNGVVVRAGQRLDFTAAADAVIIGSGVKSRDITQDAALPGQIRLDPKCQLVASQCSGALLLAQLGLLGGLPVCTELNTKTWVGEAGVPVIDKAFKTKGNVATAGGCLASVYLTDVDHPALGITGRRCNGAPARHSRRAANRIYRSRDLGRGTLSPGRAYLVSAA